MGKCVKPENPPRSNAVSEIGDHWIETNCRFVLVFTQLMPQILLSSKFVFDLRWHKMNWVPKYPKEMELLKHIEADRIILKIHLIYRL